MSPIVLIGAGALILLIGAGLGYWIANLQGQRDIAKADEVRAELNRYRRDVSEHFGKTATHFEAIGAEYRKLYDHMASGEAALCDSDRPVSFEPPERIAAATDMAPPQPRDYDIADAEVTDQELPEIVTSDVADVEEPTDRDLAETEAAEEIIAEHELVAEDAETEKTLH
jgi:uncharacterized membrane-anchored protein YhcB (DUF1043 family)